MNLLKKLFFAAVYLIEATSNAQSTKQVNLVFHPVVGNQPLIFDSTYTTPLGDTFSITKFKFFISHILFTDYSNHQKQFTDYFLVDENDSTTQVITLQSPMESFTTLEFTIGIDSAKNVSGVQTGALDPATGMFWTWNSGYIMAKLEGKSPQSKAPFGNITYHIGGFHQKDNAIRKISLPIMNLNGNRETSIESSSLTSSIHKDAGSRIHDSSLTSHKITININVDLNKWFDGPYPIKIADKSFCMSPSKLAMEIADNYANMFSIKSISVN